jgi:hypothetical protein
LDECRIVQFGKSSDYKDKYGASVTLASLLYPKLCPRVALVAFLNLEFIVKGILRSVVHEK